MYKLWGIRAGEVERLLPFIHIANAYTVYQKKEVTTTKYSGIKPVVVDINTASLQQLRIIPGMGNGMVFRFLNYREKLGGFVAVEQAKETFGMNDSCWQLMSPFLQLNSINTQKININTATDYELSKHPYIEKNIAKAIVLYRLQHGNYQTIEGIKKIVFIKETAFNKIAPYISVE
jgi:competence ComEA-like helix-hairpin-helix protein